MAFDFGNANEAQRSAISTTDGPGPMSRFSTS